MEDDGHRLQVKNDHVVDKLVVYLGTSFFILTIVFATAQITARNIFPVLGIGTTIFWTEPAARMALVNGAFWGAAAASQNEEHIVIRFPLDKLREKSEYAYIASRLLNAVVVISFTWVIFYGMMLKVLRQWHTTFPGLKWIPGGVIFLSISLATMFIAYYEIYNIYNELKEEGAISGHIGGW